MVDEIDMVDRLPMRLSPYRPVIKHVVIDALSAMRAPCGLVRETG